MDDRFYNAFLPPSVRVCGRVLSKFTVWHHFLLSANGSPVVTGAEHFSVPDLLIAVRACGNVHGEPPAFRLKLIDAFWSWRLRRNPGLFRREAEKFFQWMALQSSPPKFWRKSQGGTHKTLDNGPQCLALVCSLMNRGGIARGDAWNMPVGEAKWTDTQLAQISGIDLHFLDDKDCDDSEVDLSQMSDDEALAMFMRDLPTEELARATFEDWKANIKGKGVTDA